MQETWLKPCLDFVVPGYESERLDRVNRTGEGCATFIREGIQYQRLSLNTLLECVTVRIWIAQGKINIVIKMI